MAAVGAVAGAGPLQIASIVEATQDALLGVAAVLLTRFFAFKIGADASPGTQKKFTDPAALTLAFVSIGLEFNIQSAEEAGWKPVVVFVATTVVNLVVESGACGDAVRRLEM